TLLGRGSRLGTGLSRKRQYRSAKSKELTTMNVRTRKALTTIAAVLAFSFTQVSYLQAGPPQRVITARLTTKNNQPITVNGNSVGTGGTILTGATIETPDQVSATIDLGDAGTGEL